MSAYNVAVSCVLHYLMLGVLANLYHLKRMKTQQFFTALSVLPMVSVQEQRFTTSPIVGATAAFPFVKKFLLRQYHAAPRASTRVSFDT